MKPWIKILPVFSGTTEDFEKVFEEYPDFETLLRNCRDKGLQLTLEIPEFNKNTSDEDLEEFIKEFQRFVSEK